MGSGVDYLQSRPLLVVQVCAARNHSDHMLPLKLNVKEHYYDEWTS